jgi:hypothetical protein
VPHSGYFFRCQDSTCSCQAWSGVACMASMKCDSGFTTSPKPPPNLLLTFSAALPCWPLSYGFRGCQSAKTRRRHTTLPAQAIHTSRSGCSHSQVRLFSCCLHEIGFKHPDEGPQHPPDHLLCRGIARGQLSEAAQLQVMSCLTTLMRDRSTLQITSCAEAKQGGNLQRLQCFR